jgi:dipeptidyl aminopeptidase/acylaminoacyl peptidase
MRSRVSTSMRDKFAAAFSTCVLWTGACIGLKCITVRAASERAGAHRLSTSDAAVARPIPVETILQEKSLNWEEPFTVSPDNQLVAFVQCGLTDDPSLDQLSSYTHTRTGMRIYARGCTVQLQDLRSGHRKQVNTAGAAFGPAWSPDGQTLAYYSDEGGFAQVRIWNRRTGKSRAVPNLTARPYDEPIVWQADSQAMYARALPEGVTIEQANHDDDAQFKPPTQVPRQPIHVLPPLEFPRSPEAISPSVAARVATVTDVVRVDPSSLNFTRIVRQVPIDRFWVAPDGKHLAFIGASYTSEQSHEFWLSRVVLVDTRSLKQTALADPVTAYGHLIWSPDSELLAYMTTGFNDPGDLTVYDVPSNGQAFSTKRLAHPRFGFQKEFGYQVGWPLWTPDGTRLVLGTPHEVWAWERKSQKVRHVTNIPDTDLVAHVGSLPRSTAWVSTDGHSVAFLAIDPSTKNSQIYTVDLETGGVEKSYDQPAYWGVGGADDIPRGIDLDIDGKVAYGIIQNSNRRPAIYRLDRGLSVASEIVSFDTIDKEYALGTTDAVEWRGLNGETIRGALLLPAGYQPGHRYPLIVTQYPFSLSSDYRHFYGLSAISPVGDWQFLATRGYAILSPDLPLKSMKIDEIAGQLERAVDRIVELGIADPKRVGVEGQSMGGHTCIAAIEGTDRFAAAVCENAVWVALTTEHFTLNADGTYMTGIGYGLYNLGGSFWQNKPTFLRNDLVLNADRIKTPLLIIRGDLDPFPMNGDALYVALRDLGRPVSYVRYANVAHDLKNAPPTIRKDYLTRVEAWFDRYLKQGSEP